MTSPEGKPSLPLNSKSEGDLLESLQERKKPSLGELNPLIFPPDLERRETVEALHLALDEGIKKYGGQKPELIKVVRVTRRNMSQEPRFVISWKTPFLSEEQAKLLEELTAATYKPQSVATRLDYGGTLKRKPSLYPRIDATFFDRPARRFVDTRIGWCLGTQSGEPDQTSEGLLLYREIDNQSIASAMRGEKNHDWFTFKEPVNYKGKPVKTQYLVEIRANELYQTELVKFAIQTARVLNGEKTLPNPRLTYEIYQSLNQFGLKRRRREDIYGLDEVINCIETYLFFPLRHLKETLKRKIEVSSVLLIGVPGTGKTLLAEYFLQQDLGVFLVPVPVEMLAGDLAKSKKIIERISSVSQETGIPVVIQVDDIESIAKEAETMNATLMNLMAGVRERGFFVLGSTNKPYELSYQLLQPQRFGHILHIPLPDEQARLGILKIHAPEEYFANPEQREIILPSIAQRTEKFDSRLLKAVCDTAQINSMTRDSFGSNLTAQDFEKALALASKGFSQKEAAERERQLAGFANKHHVASIGFLSPRP